MITPSQTRPRGSAWPWLVALALAFVAGVALTSAMRTGWQRWTTRSAPARSQTPARPAPATARPPAPDAATLAAREAALAGQLAALEARAASVVDTVSAAGDQASRAENMLVALSVRRAIDRGTPLGYLESQLRRRFPGQPDAVATLIAAAREPVTLQDLREALDAGTAATLTSGGVQDGWSATLWRELTGLVVIRRVGTPSPRPSDRMARARRLLDQGQVRAALAEVDRLPGAPAATNWRTAARRFVLARRALEVIEAAAITAPRPLPPPPAAVVPPTGAAPVPEPGLPAPFL